MPKNLSKFKILVKTRECLIQAIYQLLMEGTSIEDLIDQFSKEHQSHKVDLIYFKIRLESLIKNLDQINKMIQLNSSNNEGSQIIDQAIMYFAINENIMNELPKEIIIDESIRLSKKFSNENAYKFINAKLDQIYRE